MDAHVFFFARYRVDDRTRSMERYLAATMLCFLVVSLSFANAVWTNESAMCTGNHTLLEAPGDAIITVFVDTNDGPFCNETTAKGFQEVSTALYVVQMLNKYDFVPGLSLGLKVFDTCHDSVTTYKQALMEAVAFDCVDYYELGILVPAAYGSLLKPLGDYNVLPVSIYKEANMTSALVDAMLEFLTATYEVVDLLLVDSNELLPRILDASRDSGICVKSINEVAELDNDTEAIIVIVGSNESLRLWIQKGDDSWITRKTWIVLPIDDSYVDDAVPSGSFIIKTETFNFDLLQEFPSVDDFLETSEYPVIHSPYLLSIGKSIIEIAEVLVELQRRTCPHREACVLPRFNANKSHREISNAKVYEALHILPKSHIIKYVVSRRNGVPDTEEFTRVATYNVNVTSLQVTAEVPMRKMPKLCLKNAIGRCRKCANFRVKLDSQAESTKEIIDSSANHFLKSGVLVPIFLTVMACGTLASIVIIFFIVYRYYAERVLDGNPSLTILLALANVFVLQTTLPFCMNDEPNELREYVNSRKIFVSSLSLGITFSIMLSRAFFLAFSTGGTLTSHVNGYLQGLMVFFMAGVQVAISIMYFVLGPSDSARVVRSLTFVALLGYDIFLLFVLFVVCCFVSEIQRNYREGKCFFGTVIGLLVAWAIWLTCFVLVKIETRDTIVCTGMIATGYIIIIGILIPRTYYMVTNLAGGKDFLRRYETSDHGPDPRTSTIARQQGVTRPFHDYVHPMERITGGAAPESSRYPNYYGSPTPNTPYRTGGRVTSGDPTRPAAYNNYGYRPDMQEVEGAYVVPRVRLEDPEGSRIPVGRQSKDEVCYAQPRCPGKQKLVYREPKDRIETDVYVEDRRLSPSKRGPDEAYPSRCTSPRLYQTEDTILEEEEDRDVMRITRL